jgi:broad specificity phosphatase PhoE
MSTKVCLDGQNYGKYEGRLTADVLAERPGWQLFRDGCPDGESPEQVTERADRIVKRISGVKGNVLLFSSGHFLRVLAARWLGMETLCARFFMISTATVSTLGSENSGTQPAILFWNDVHHLLKAHNESYG